MASTAKSKKRGGSGLLDDLEPLSGGADLRPVLYKTVDTFSGITQKKLYLKHDTNGPARTDGRCITADLTDEDVYSKVEHELSHVLFCSDPVAKALFVETYQGRILKFATDQGLALNKRVVADMLDFIVNIIEDRRVDSLWGLLYAGSAKLQRQLHFRIVQTFAHRAHESFLLYFACVEAEVPTSPGPLDKFRPLFQHALTHVERKGFLATLTLSKWLVTALVSEILKHAFAGAPSPGESPAPSQAGAGAKKEAQGSGNPEESSAEGSPDEEDSEPGKGSAGSIAAASGAGGSGGDAGEALEGPEVGSETAAKNAKQRADAFAALASISAVPVELRAAKADLVVPEYKERDADKKAAKLVEEALAANLSSSEAIEALLAATVPEMEAIASRARQAIKPPVSLDEWISKDSMAKVNFHDITKADVTKTAPLPDDDLETVRRLRALFTRTMGRRRTTLDDAGTEIDVGALIERRLSKQPIPCFKREEQGKGFRSLVLLDRSSSMAGVRSAQAERACRIIGKALKFPFATTDTWGFQSLLTGNVDITRFEPNLEGFTSAKSKVGGSTPLHAAIRMAARYLDQGTETKQLIIITDGEPHHYSKAGTSIPQAQLQEWVRKEVLHARRRGIHVTCLMIGSTVPPSRLRLMFGPQSNWKTVDEARLGTDLVNLVSASFVKYLSAR